MSAGPPNRIPRRAAFFPSKPMKTNTGAFVESSYGAVNGGVEIKGIAKVRWRDDASLRSFHTGYR